MKKKTLSRALWLLDLKEFGKDFCLAHRNMFE